MLCVLSNHKECLKLNHSHIVIGPKPKLIIFICDSAQIYTCSRCHRGGPSVRPYNRGLRDDFSVKFGVYVTILLV